MEIDKKTFEKTIKQYVAKLKADLIAAKKSKAKFDKLDDKKFRAYVLKIAKGFHDNPYEKEKNNYMIEFDEIVSVMQEYGEHTLSLDVDFWDGGWKYRGFRLDCYCGQGCYYTLRLRKKILASTFC